MLTRSSVNALNARTTYFGLLDLKVIGVQSGKQGVLVPYSPRL